MNKKELEQWLYGDEVTPPTPSAIATALGLPVDEVADTTLLRTATKLRSLRLTLAVLQDLFTDDIDVSIWLAWPRRTLDGMSARQAMVSGRTALVESLAIRAWNERIVSRV